MDQSLYIGRSRVCMDVWVCVCVCVCVCIMPVLCVQTDLKDIAELVPDHLNNINITILTLYYSLHYVYKVHTLIFKYFIVIKTLTII